MANLLTLHNGVFFQLIVLPLLVFSVQLNLNYCSDQSVSQITVLRLQTKQQRGGEGTRVKRFTYSCNQLEVRKPPTPEALGIIL